ncbi:hypothetical protein [Gracilibacillus xinjiangensis]|uniref:Uncharacterized protein n=1 Tax=Gracilibacillus xinjiangensis TaxID=1193282 RepID=A0ABV8X1C9_9BACI
MNSVGEITYSVDSIGSFGESGATLNDNGVLKESNESNPKNAKVTKNTEVVVTVNWNENCETFKLDMDMLVEIEQVM